MSVFSRSKQTFVTVLVSAILVLLTGCGRDGFATKGDVENSSDPLCLISGFYETRFSNFNHDSVDVSYISKERCEKTPGFQITSDEQCSIDISTLAQISCTKTNPNYELADYKTFTAIVHSATSDSITGACYAPCKQ